MVKERNIKYCTDIAQIWSNEIDDAKTHIKAIKPDIQMWAKNKEFPSDG